MAHVMIGEPSADVRDLLARMLARLGHEACLVDPPLNGAALPDVFLFEPAAVEYLALAADLRERAPDLPLVACSILPPTDETRALGPVRHLLKPFLRAELAEAIEHAIRSSRPC